MNRTYKALLKKLHEKYPGKHVNITLENNWFDTDGYIVQYYVYVEDIESKHQTTLSDVKAYVEYLCKKEAKK